MREVTVLERIADGLGILRGHLRLASGDGDDGAYDAKRHLDKAQEGWTPRDTHDRGAMANAIAGVALAIAGVALNLGRFDTAQQFAASALRAFDDGFGREPSFCSPRCTCGPEILAG